MEARDAISCSAKAASLLVVAVAAAFVVARNWSREGAVAGTPNAITVVATVVCATVLVVEVVLFLLLPDQFIAASHGIAAVTMVVGVIAVMVLNAASCLRPA